MILITGNDPIVDALCSVLDSLGRPYRRVDKLDSGHAWELHATPKPVAPWRARVGRWLGARTLDSSTASPAPAPT